MAADAEKEQQDMTPQEAADFGRSYAISKGEIAIARDASAVSEGAWSALIIRHNVLNGARPSAVNSAMFLAHERVSKEEASRKVDDAISKLDKYISEHPERKI